MSKQIRTKRFLYSLIFKIALLIVIFVAGLSLLLFSNYKKYSLETIYQSNLNLLHQISKNTTQLNYYSRTYATSLLYTRDVLTLMYSEELSNYDRITNLQNFDTTLISTPFVYSAYIYNGRLDTFFTAGNEIQSLKKDNFYDEDIVEYFDSISQGKLNSCIPRSMKKANVNQEETVDVYSYVLFEKFKDTNKIKNALVLNIRSNWVLSALANIEDSIDSYTNNNLLLLTNEGQVIGDNYANQFLNNLSDESFFKKLKLQNAKQGFFESTYNNEKVIISYITADAPFDYFVSVVPYAKISKSILYVRNITLTIAVIMIILGLIISYILSKNIYSPIALLKTRIEDLFATSNNSKNIVQSYDEFTYIASNIDSTATQIKSLENFKNKNIMSLKQNYLHNLVYTKNLTLDQTISKFKEYDLSIDPSEQLLMIYFHIDHYDDYFSNTPRSDIELLQFAFINIANEVLFEEFHNEIFSLGERAFIAILNVPNTSINNFDTILKNLLIILKGHIKKYLNFEISIFVSSLCNQIQDLNNCYINLLNLSKYLISYGNGCILFESNLNEDNLADLKLSDKKFSKLFLALKADNRKASIKNINLIFNELYKCSHNTIMTTLSYLTAVIFNIIKDIEKTHQLTFEIRFVDFNRKFRKLETLDESKEAYLQLFDNLFNNIDAKKAGRFDELVNRIIDIIKKEYENEELSANSIADKFHLSVPYLNRIFKEYTCKSISTYISSFRIEKAKELLLASDYNIDVILIKIGWTNKKYFYTIFKKEVGQTPTQYRINTANDN